MGSRTFRRGVLVDVLEQVRFLLPLIQWYTGWSSRGSKEELPVVGEGGWMVITSDSPPFHRMLEVLRLVEGTTAEAPLCVREKDSDRIAPNDWPKREA